MKDLKQLTEEFRKLQAHRRRIKIEKMTNFHNVTLTISGVTTNFVVSVKVTDEYILIKPCPYGMHQGQLHLWPGMLGAEDIISRQDTSDSVILDLYPPLPQHYQFRFQSIDQKEHFVNLIRASREPSTSLRRKGENVGPEHVPPARAGPDNDAKAGAEQERDLVEKRPQSGQDEEHRVEPSSTRHRLRIPNRQQQKLWSADVNKQNVGSNHPLGHPVRQHAA